MISKKIYYIDIDNTICYTKNSDYNKCIPYYDRIKLINDLYHEGHTIIYWTSRGQISGKVWENFTNKQLDNWGCLRHKIIFNKPHYDIFIDDKSINSDLFFNSNNII